MVVRFAYIDGIVFFYIYIDVGDSVIKRVRVVIPLNGLIRRIVVSVTNQDLGFNLQMPLCSFLSEFLQ